MALLHFDIRAPHRGIAGKRQDSLSDLLNDELLVAFAEGIRHHVEDAGSLPSPLGRGFKLRATNEAKCVLRRLLVGATPEAVDGPANEVFDGRRFRLDTGGRQCCGGCGEMQCRQSQPSQSTEAFLTHLL